MSNNEYFAKWYEANKQKIADRRKERYQNDPEYKAKVLANSKRSRSPKFIDRGAGRIVGKDGVERNAYSLAEASVLLGVSRETLVAWVKGGLVPANPFANFYTIGQVNAVRYAIELRKQEGKRVHIKRSDFGFAEIVSERWNELAELNG
jgi:hypothetical protein